LLISRAEIFFPIRSSPRFCNVIGGHIHELYKVWTSLSRMCCYLLIERYHIPVVYGLCLGNNQR
jgi:hypothetical protein